MNSPANPNVRFIGQRTVQRGPTQTVCLDGCRESCAAAVVVYATVFRSTILPACENLEAAAVGDNLRVSDESGRAPLRQGTPALRWHLVASKRFANAHSEGVTVPTLGDIGSKIDVVLLLSSNRNPPPPEGRKWPLSRICNG